MTPAERSAAQNYLSWVGQLVALFNAIANMPLDELLAVNLRATLAGTLMGPNGHEAADPVKMARQRALIEQAIVYRDTIRRPAEGADP